MGYSIGSVTLKGEHHMPPRPVPKTNAWNVSIVLTDVQDTNEAVRRCLDQCPGIVDRVQTLRERWPDIKCTFYLGLRPFTDNFVLFFEKETMHILDALRCDLSIEYFDDDSAERQSSGYGDKNAKH